MEILDALLKVSQAGSTVLLTLAVWAFATGKVVPRWIHDEALKREESWRLLYEREKATSEKLLERAEQVRVP